MRRRFCKGERKMGIALYQLLAQEYFKDFHVVAGQRGLSREVQGVAVMDAPDALRWTKGKELIMTSGYSLSKEPHCLERSFQEGAAQMATGLMIKRQRYLDTIPDRLIELFEQHGVPLISMPFEVAFMDVINQVNVAVMNHAFKCFRIRSDNVFRLSNLSFKERKIKKILQAVEAQMDFPAFLYDINEGRSYYSSANFMRISERFCLKDEDYWNPSREHTKHSLCEHMHMTRYRLIDPVNPTGPKISWVLIPIIMNDVTQAFFVVMESRDFLDYCDEYSIRIAFLELQSVYEQIMVAQSIGNIGFENFILYALNYDEKDPDRLIYQASQHGISMSKKYICIMFSQTKDESVSARDERKSIVRAFMDCTVSKSGKLAFLDENRGLILWDAQENDRYELEYFNQILEEFRLRVKEKCCGMELEFAVCRDGANLLSLKDSVKKCQKVMTMGKKLFAQDYIWDYEKLGPYVWIDIGEEELEAMLGRYRLLLQDERNREPLKTLKVYLENNMNFSVTAEKMYVHINTIRKRIDKMKELLDVSLDDRIARLKLEMLLQFLNL